MNRKKELCRNFQRGSCQYGDRCKFLHPTQQQARPGGFGFGVQSGWSFPSTSQQREQQKPNPFGFGVQTSPSSSPSQPQPQPQPFSNKWTRPSAGETPSTKPSSKPADGQPQGVHQCTDPEACRRQIIEDLDLERPLWKLTCYGHNRGKACDIVGDVSYEELRAAAYDDARKGVGLQTIVERERNLLNAKLTEFNNLRQKPQTVLSQSFATANASLLPSSVLVGTNASSPVAARPSAFSFGAPGVTGTPDQGQIAGIFGQASVNQVQNQSSSAFQATQYKASDMTVRTPMTSQGNQFSGAAQMMPNWSGSTVHLHGESDSGKIFGQQLTSSVLVESREEISAEDAAIWLKGEWEMGEIPEEEPPARFCL